MKLLLAVAFLAISAPALGCGPTGRPAGRTSPIDRGEMTRQAARAAPNIVYGIVERDVTSRPGQAGIFRVLRVYKGGLRAGQRIPMRYAAPTGGCVIPRPGYVYSQARGTSGVLLLGAQDRRGVFPFRGFLAAEYVQWLVRDGFIPSAPPAGTR